MNTKTYLGYTVEEIQKYLAESKNLTNEEIKEKYDIEIDSSSSRVSSASLPQTSHCKKE